MLAGGKKPLVAMPGQERLCGARVTTFPVVSRALCGGMAARGGPSQKSGDILQSSAPRRDDDRCITIVRWSHDLFIVHSASTADVCTETVAAFCCSDIDVLTFLLDVDLCFNIFVRVSRRSLSFEATSNKVLHTACSSGVTAVMSLWATLSNQRAASRGRVEAL